jgi:protein SCO1/2
VSLAAAVIAVLIVLIAAYPSPAHGDESVPPILREVGIVQNLGATVPANLAFVDERGQAVRLGDYFGTKPIVLTMNDLNCPNLCSLMLDSLASGLGELPFALGRDYQVVTVSISPRDTPAIAAEVKSRYIAPGSKLAPGIDWHILTGDPVGVQALAQAIGFNYAYDAEQQQFAHPAGLVILTPDGRIARYLFGIDFLSRDLRFALIDASNRQIGSPTDQILLTCYHYEATLGRYAGLALESVRIAGVATVLLLAAGLAMLWRRDLRAR